MTERQQALLTYAMTIAKHVQGFRSVDELTNRIMKCVREDAAFVAQGFANAFIDGGRHILERKAVDVVGLLAKKAESFFSGWGR